MTRPLEWMTAVRDHPDRPPLDQCHVLTCLVLRLDWRAGAGPASAAQLAADARCGERTVKYATRWARAAGLLVRTKRGHRLGDGTTRASEWQLCLPSQPVTGDLLASPSTGSTVHVEETSTGSTVHIEKAVSRGTNRRLKGHEPASQRARSAPPSRPSPSRPSPSSAHGPAGLIIRAAYPDATDDEIETIIKDRIGNGARSPAAVLAHETREGILRLPCDRDGPHGHSDECRAGDPGRCGMPWCICRCHIEPKADQ